MKNYLKQLIKEAKPLSYEDRMLYKGVNYPIASIYIIESPKPNAIHREVWVTEASSELGQRVVALIDLYFEKYVGIIAFDVLNDTPYFNHSLDQRNKSILERFNVTPVNL